MATGSITMADSLEAVLERVHAYARKDKWVPVPEGSSRTDLTFTRTRLVNWASSKQVIKVSIDPEGGAQSRVTVATKPKNQFGGSQLFDWGQGKRITNGLIAFLTESPTSQ
jgi:hypothetical protein